ncbi:hypothetical protein EVAR_69904_1 [Eumeta japonica]|uniref:Uncharacterized protein n=1 Tax=Eumeta variegata TaxID=151549 RepID=A0A4C1T3K4_EUMVA|nr:hypothetical protein EVAR_69904_1 [Eumeta japonica]
MVKSVAFETKSCVIFIISLLKLTHLQSFYYKSKRLDFKSSTLAFEGRMLPITLQRHCIGENGGQSSRQQLPNPVESEAEGLSWKFTGQLARGRNRTLHHSIPRRRS